jgi:N-acetylglucosamine kinase-like BadF-type ATPase
MIRERFELSSDLDLCAAVYGPPTLTRSELAALAPLAARAARQGDAAARQLFAQAAQELAAIVHACRDQLHVPLRLSLPVSYSGGMFRLEDLLQPLLENELCAGDRSYEFAAPRLAPVAGAALYAAKLAGTPLCADSISQLAREDLA